MLTLLRVPFFLGAKRQDLSRAQDGCLPVLAPPKGPPKKVASNFAHLALAISFEGVRHGLNG